MKLQELLADHIPGHTRFQCDYWITGMHGGTAYGQYKQALRELTTRVSSIKQRITDYELLLIDIEELQGKIQSACSFDLRRFQIELRQKTWLAEVESTRLQKSLEEMSIFYSQAIALKQVVGDLTPERLAEFDREMWEIRVKEKLAIDYMSQGRPGKDTLQMIQAAPAAVKKELYRHMNADVSGLITWFESHENYRLPNQPEQFLLGISDIKMIEAIK